MTVAEDRFNALLDAAVDAIVLIDERGRIQRFNPAAEKLFGYRPEEILQRNVSVLMPEPYRSEHDDYLHRYQQTDQARIIGIGREVTARRKDGTQFPIDLSVGEFVSASERGYVGILRDITQRRLQESQLKNQAEELRAIFENAPTPMLITQVDGRIVKINRACSTLLGYQNGTLQAQRQSDLLHPEDQPLAIAEFSQLMTGAVTSSRCELRYLRADGTVVHTITYAARTEHSSGDTGLVISEIIDRTALLNAEREAEELRSRLAHAGRIGTLGEMVSGIAHEVNQPLTAIANYASACRRLLQSGQGAETDLVGTLEKISAQAERAGQVIRGLRSLTRRRDAVREMLDVNQLIREVSRLLDFELRNSGWRLLLNLQTELPAVMGDGVQIQQVILNLVRNGIEAMNERATCDHIEIQTLADNAFVEIEVRDCGPGIPESATGHLFEPFYTTKHQGMGLGLSICQSIAGAHGGEIRYLPNPRGACFRIRLPAADN